MQTLRAAVNFAGWRILSIWAMLLPTIALAKEPAKGQPARDSSSCELILGKRIESLTLTDQQGQPVVFRRGSGMCLPPGQYLIQGIDLPGGYSSLTYGGHPPDRLTLVPGKPCRFDIRAPLTPSVAVKREGRLLKLDYQLLDGDGRKYRRNDPSGSDRSHPPQFAVYQGESLIGSGSFEYG